MALTDKLTAIANAIRGKTGKTEHLTLDAMPGEIEGIQTGGGGGIITGGWQRPSNWPDLSSLGKPEPGTIYLTYDCRNTISGISQDMISLYKSGGDYWTLQRGRVENGEFVPVATLSGVEEVLPVDEGDFVVYKLTVNKTWAFNYSNTYASQPCVEVYGCAEGDMGSLARPGPSNGPCFVTKALTLWGNNQYILGGTGNRIAFVEYANIEEWAAETTKTDLSYAFCNNPYMREIKAIPCNTASVKNFGSMYRSLAAAERIDVSTLDTSSAMSMSYMFSGCEKIRYLNLNNFVTDKVTNFTGMFNGCKSLYTLEFSSLDTSACTTSPLKMLDSCPELVNLTVGKITMSFTVNCNYLSHDSLMNIINALEPTSTAKTLTIGSTNLKKLTEVEIAVATEKGWSIL